MRKKLKILYVITKSNWGGAQRYVYDLASAFAEQGHEVVVACGGNGLLVDKLKGKKIRAVPVQAFQRDINLIKEICAFFELLSLFRREQPNVVHLNSSKAGGIGALAGRLSGVPHIIFTAHGWYFHENKNALVRGITWFLSFITQILAHHTITVSEFDRTTSPLPSKSVLIHNGIALLHLESGEKIRTAFPPGVPITGTIGELTHNKNQVALIEEAKNDPAMHVAIVGEGELRRELETKIRAYGLEDRVKLFGFLPAREALRGFDTFALPSRKEGLPYVLLEARMAGLPIKANRVGGVGEILDAEDMGEFTLERMVQKTEALYLSA